jgi:uncharacterized protein YbjT (DUF2867 family)
MISSIGAENPPDGEDTFSVYLRAKAQADEALMASDREWTIVRPGLLTDDSGSGRVRIDSEPFRERVPREDVAAVLNVVLHEPRSARRVLYVGSGEDEIEAAVEKVLGRTGVGAPRGRRRAAPAVMADHRHPCGDRLPSSATPSSRAACRARPLRSAVRVRR